MHGYVGNGFKAPEGGNSNPIVERNHTARSSSYSTGYVDNGYAHNEIQSNGIKSVPVVERTKEKKEVYTGNGFDMNNNQSGTTGRPVTPRNSTVGIGYVGNGFGQNNNFR